MNDITEQARVIAKGLTKAQRGLVLRHGEQWQRLAEPGLGRGSGARAATDVRHIESLFETKWGGDCYRYRLTPLGQQVREILLSEGGE